MSSKTSFVWVNHYDGSESFSKQIFYGINRYAGSQSARQVYALNHTSSTLDTEQTRYYKPYSDTYKFCLALSQSALDFYKYSLFVIYKLVLTSKDGTEYTYEFNNVGEIDSTTSNGDSTCVSLPTTSTFESSYTNTYGSWVNNTLTNSWQDRGAGYDYSINSNDALASVGKYYYIYDTNWDLSTLGNFKIDAYYKDYKAGTTNYTITTNLTNCSITPTDTSIAEGTETTFTITANDGYELHETPTITGGTFTVASDKLSATATITVNSDITITANATKVYTVDRNLNHCTISPDITSITEGENYIFTVSAETGYGFTRTEEQYLSITGGTFTVSEDKLTATSSEITASQNVTILAHALIYQTVTTYTVTRLLDNCTISPDITSISEGSEYTFTVTANSGYQFDDTPTITGGTFTVASDKLSATATITASQNVTITATATAIPVTPTTYTVSRDLNHCTVSPDITSISEGSEYTFTVTANSGYEFSRTEEQYLSITGGTFTVSDDKLSATATITASQNVTILAHALILQTHKIYITGTLTHCTCNYNSGDDLISEQAVTFTADEGYYFYNLTPEYEVKKSVSSDIETETGSLNGSGTQTLIDGTQVTLYVNANTNITIISDITAIETPSDIINGVNIYVITEDMLKQLMTVRFTLGTESSSGTITEESEPIDYGKWISNLYYLPLDVTGHTSSVADIILGNKNTEFNSTLLESQFDIDLGKIIIPNFTNSYSSDSITINLYLPFISDIITIDAMFSGKELAIKYHVDLLEESIVAILTIDDTAISYNKYQIGRNIPFFSTENGNTNLHYSNDTNNSILTAYIIIATNGYNTELFAVEKNTLISFNYIEPYETTATQEEQEEINTLLNQGVIVK